MPGNFAATGRETRLDHFIHLIMAAWERLLLCRGPEATIWPSGPAESYEVVSNSLRLGGSIHLPTVSPRLWTAIPRSAVSGGGSSCCTASWSEDNLQWLKYERSVLADKSDSSKVCAKSDIKVTGSAFRRQRTFGNNKEAGGDHASCGSEHNARCDDSTEAPRQRNMRTNSTAYGSEDGGEQHVQKVDTPLKCPSVSGRPTINAGDSSSVSSDPLRMSTASTEVDEPSEATWKSAQTSNSPMLSICNLSCGLSRQAPPVESNTSRIMGTGTMELDLKDNAMEVESSASAGLEDRILGSLREHSGPEGGVLWDALTRGFIVSPEGYVSTKEIKCKAFHNFVYRRCRGQRPQGAPACPSSLGSLHIGGSGSPPSGDFEPSRYRARRGDAHCASNAGPIIQQERPSNGEAAILNPRRAINGRTVPGRHAAPCTPGRFISCRHCGSSNIRMFVSSKPRISGGTASIHPTIRHPFTPAPQGYRNPFRASMPKQVVSSFTAAEDRMPIAQSGGVEGGWRKGWRFRAKRD